MKNNFQSNGKGRNQRVWQLLISMLIILTMGIGQMWGYTFSSANIVAGNVVQDNVTITTTATSTTSVSQYYKVGSTKYAADIVPVKGKCNGGTLGGVTDYIEIKASENCYLNSPIKIQGISNGTTTIKKLAVLGWNGDAANDNLVVAQNQEFLGYAQTSFEATEVTISFTGTVTTIRLYAQSRVKNGALSSASGYTQYGDGSQVNIRQIDVTAGYFVTINPNGGAYASTPSGWSYDNVNKKYTKYVASGSFSAPDGLSKGTDVLSWKDNHDNDITFPVTINKDTIFVAQWATSSCNEPTTAFANGSYTVDGTPLILSSLISDSQGEGTISYSVKDANGTGASIAAGVFTATTAGTATVTATQAADATNGYCQKVMEATITVLAAGAVEYNISYADTKGATNSNPAKYTKGTGIAEFAALADVTDFHFTGWSPASISAEATGAQEITAQWVAAYNVTFSYGTGGGTVPTSFQKWEGAKFNLPGQGSMTAPSGKVFDGWKAGGTKYAENAEYTMGNDAVEFVAQWKAVPTTLYSLTVTKTSQVNLNNGGAQDDLSDDATIVGGGAYMQNDHANNPQQILGSTKLQFKAGTVTLVMTLTNALKEGDTIKATGLNSEGLCFGVTFDRAGSLDNQLASDASYFIVPEEFEGKTTLYAWRHSGSGTTCASIIIRRPADRPIFSTAITLSDLKVNNRSISSDSLATLVSTHSLTLKDEFAAAPEIKFNEHKVITYDDELLPATKVTDKVYTVTATTSGDNWQAQQEINSVTYTVTAPKVSAAKVYYYNGATKLGEEIVAINGSPVNAGDYEDDVNLADFVDWYSDPDLAEEHKIANIAALVVTKDTTVYGKWTNQYATSINIEQWVLDNGKGAKTTDLLSQLGSHYFATGITYVAGTNELDSLNDDPSKDNRNYAYLGLKVKTSGAMLDFRLQNGQTVKVKFGNVGTTPKVQYNNTGDYANMTITDGVYSYTATGNDYISIKTADAKAVVFKQIMIGADPAIAAVTLPWRVTYDANGGTCGTASAIWSGAALILPDVTPADADHTFAGWYDEVSGGSLIGAAGASYTPTDNTTLHAQFAPVEYAVNYAAGDHGSGDMAAANVGWGTEYTAVANGFTPETGYIFAGWAVSGVDGVSSIAAGGSFTMPKNPVTLTALWEDNSKVAVIVETNVKYESLADAITAAEAGQTIQLLQNIEQANGVAIAKNLTLDLNGKTFTCTSGSNVNSRAIKITAGNVTIQNGSIIAVPTANFEGGCYGPIRIEGASTNVTLEDLTLQNGRHYGLGIKLVEGTLRMEDCTVISENGGGGLEVGEATADVINCTFTQTGLDNAHAWISTCLATCDNGVLNVQGGTYTSEHYSMYVYTSGGEMNVESGNFTGDVVNQVTLSSYPDAVGAINISGGSFEGAGGNPIQFTTDNSGATSIAISGGTFDAPVENKYCAPGYIPSAEVAPGVYTVVPKDGVEIIGVVTTGGTNKTVTGLYKGDASVNLDNNKKIGEGNKYIYVTLKEGYTFEENDVLIVDVDGKSDLTSEKALEITTGVGNIDGAVWKTLVDAEYSTGENIISLEGIAAGQTSIGLKRSTNQNAKINGLRVLRPMNPVLKKVTVAGVEGTPDNTNHVAIEVPFTTADDALDAIAYEWVSNSNSDAWTAAHAPAVANTWEFGVENTVTFTDKDGDKSVYYVTISKAVPSSDATLATLTYGTPATAIALADGVFEYNVELPYGTSAVPALAATAHHAGANVTDIDNAAAFVNRHATSTVTVTAENGTTTQDYTVNFIVSRFESKVLWDGSTMTALSDITAAAAAAGVTVTTTGVSVSSFSAKTCEENGKSYTKALDFGGKTQSTRNFGIVIPTGKVAKVSVVYRAKGTSRSIMVATALSDAVNESTITSVEAVDGSNLYIMTADMFGGGTLYINTTEGFHVHEISLQLADGFARSSMLGNGVLGTICVPNNVAVEDIQGVTVYELMGRDYSNYGKLAFDEIVSGELEAGAPYVFQANGNHMAMLYGATHVTDPVDKGNGMYGTFEQIVLNDLTDVYYFAQRALWSCDGAQTLTVAANRAYVKLSEVGEVPSSSPNPGRRRILMTVNGEKVATDIDDVQGDNVQCIKVMIDGQLYILRGEKMYDATGRLVK